MAIQDLIGKEIPEFEMPVQWGKIKEFAEAILNFLQKRGPDSK